MYYYKKIQNVFINHLHEHTFTLMQYDPQYLWKFINATKNQSNSV